MQSVGIRRCGPVLRPDFTRVLIRPFEPQMPERTLKIIGRVMALTEEEVAEQVRRVLADFADRHHQIRAILHHHYDRVKSMVFTDRNLTDDRKMLIGAYFTQEYSLESAALFNPSIVPHPNQTRLRKGALRFIVSLRATGEGHISSITFREGIIDGSGDITVEPAAPYVTEPERIPNPSYERRLFERKIVELDLDNDFAFQVMGELPDVFTYQELKMAIRAVQTRFGGRAAAEEAVQGILGLANSNHEVRFDPRQSLSERIVFPSSPSQRNGIEDARFVYFQNDDGSHTYYATFTAFDGRVIFPELLETRDFLDFRFITLNGPAVRNKGMALFPRKINDSYVMLSRQDNENNYIMFSDNIHFWHEPRLLVRPSYPWEFVQMGNCGSPIELDDGWLVLSHGVGPMRRYCIGALLLDKKDPTKVIGRSAAPLLKPNENEREGYVPNVVYTCGALVHGDMLVIPYAMSDYASTFAIAPVGDVLNAMI